MKIIIYHKTFIKQILSWLMKQQKKLLTTMRQVKDTGETEDTSETDNTIVTEGGFSRTVK